MKILVAFVLIIIGLTALPESQIEGQVLAQVSSEKSVKWDATQEYCLAQNIYFEAGNQSLEGMAAVADVTLNRVENDSYPNDICSVVKEGLKHPDGAMKRHMCQFSWYCDGKSDEIPVDSLHLGINEAWKNSQHIARAMLLEYNLTDVGTYFGITEGSTHYHATYVVPNWINDRGMVRIRQIGSHIFYKFH
jgi:spore germination cell wall hydrolase CwlJ-like protein